MTKILAADPGAIREAVTIFRRGGLVAFPTETVYGLGADAENEAAVRAMFAAKLRPADHPVIVHLADAALLDRFAADVPPLARTLADAFWPGPMTLVLRRSERISPLVTGGLDTVGLRVPAHPVAQMLLREFGGAVAAPSANRFGRVSPTRAEHVLADMCGVVDLVLDGGPCSIGVESTILDATAARPIVLRPGAITAEQVESLLGAPAVVPASRETPRVSGSLPSHYAPRARVELVSEEALLDRARQFAAIGQRVAVLHSSAAFADSPHIHGIQIPASAKEFAHALYALLRHVDELGCDIALIAPPKEEGLGVAIADRLRRSAGPRHEDANDRR
jgi:L-threonylcarbamoyladenylate synthase